MTQNEKHENQITYYLDVVSSWCHWAEPAWAELKRHYAKAPVEFDWQIALLDGSGMSKSREQCDWFYRRSGTIVGSPFKLDSGWLDPVLPEFLAANCVAETAKDFGVSDEHVVKIAAVQRGHQAVPLVLHHLRARAEFFRERVGDFHFKTDHPLRLLRIGKNIRRAALGVRAPFEHAALLNLLKRIRGVRKIARAKAQQPTNKTANEKEIHFLACKTR